MIPPSPDQIIVILLAIIAIESAIIFTYSFQTGKDDKKKENPYRNFRLRHYFFLVYYGMLCLIILYYLTIVFKMPSQIFDKIATEGLDNSLAYVSIFIAFTSFGLSVFIQVYNWINGLFKSVNGPNLEEIQNQILEMKEILQGLIRKDS